ncbi:MAG: single-stranded DNA-binding protein [Deltaproteobacteria bacterium]|jgi:single-strand DNA-binding protein|nr:single-stranded DNA-binding protein [Deltaproteobacteria bacterium]
MAGVNKVILLGRLGKDPETRYTQASKAMTTFSLATSERFGNEEKTEWHRIVMFDRVAEVASQYLKKGDQVYLEGKIQSRVWEDQKGLKHYQTDILCNVMQMLGGGRREGADPPPPSAELGAESGSAEAQERDDSAPDAVAAAEDPLPTDEDMPF